jgi:hypothetical protein
VGVLEEKRVVLCDVGDKSSVKCGDQICCQCEEKAENGEVSIVNCISERGHWEFSLFTYTTSFKMVL